MILEAYKTFYFLLYERTVFLDYYIIDAAVFTKVLPFRLVFSYYHVVTRIFSSLIRSFEPQSRPLYFEDPLN